MPSASTQNAIGLLRLILFSLIILQKASASTSDEEDNNKCLEPPAGCTLDCAADGFVKASASQCLCMCRQPLLTCFGLACKGTERCVNVNGKAACVPMLAVGRPPLSAAVHQQQSQLAFLARPVVPGPSAASSSSGAVSAVHLGPRDQYLSIVSPPPPSSFQQQHLQQQQPQQQQQLGLLGECPALVSGNCEVQCQADSDCPQQGAVGIRCCPNGCGRQCVPSVSLVPVQSHLAIRPLRPDGAEKVGSHSGESVTATQCGTVKCSNSLYECQLVESDCGQPPCPTVPKCLINPCPSGSPMKLANGVTALCKRQSQCWQGFWCHQIGYNGLGFCCPEPRKSSKPGSCAKQEQTAARQSSVLLDGDNTRNGGRRCTAECNSDGDCAGGGQKCCFDGCGLACRTARNVESKERGEHGEEEVPQQQLRPSKERKKGQQKKPPPATTAAAECPIVVASDRLSCQQPGRDDCARDSDCPGRLRCCSDGCFLRCTHISASLLGENGEQKQQQATGPSDGRGEGRPQESLVRLVPAEGAEGNGGGSEIGPGGKKMGQCPAESHKQFCGRKRRRAEGEEQCQTDADCPSLQKCCPDGCGNRLCQFPGINSQCLAQRASAQIVAIFSKHNRIFQPICDVQGRFLPIQSRAGSTWCVDGTGREVAGTRAPSEHFEGCERRRICPVQPCSLQCPHGHQMDGLGCPQCICQDSPCRSVQCPEGNVCRLVAKKCLPDSPDGQDKQSAAASTCLVPECVLNTCLRGEPLEAVVDGALVGCDEQRAHKCPAGFYCQKLGIGTAGYCCSGLVLQSELVASASRCPAMPNLLHRRRKMEEEESEDHLMGCRLSKECPAGGVCCFNGWGSECTGSGGTGTNGENSEEPAEEENAGRKPIENKRVGDRQRGKQEEEDNAETSSSNGGGVDDADTFVLQNSDGQKQCPARLLNASNPGCTSNCATHSDCIGRTPQMRCCKLGCGQQCVFPDRMGPCAHLLASTLREVDKLSSKAANTFGTPTVQCTLEGLFQPVQFDALTGQYWCVDPATGHEQPGTRISSSPIGSALPDCAIRHQCRFSCQKEAKRCEHGARLDHRGCPVDERCECRSPCDDFKCSLPTTEICLLKRVKCVDNAGGPCPAVPYCVKNICRQSQLELGSPRLCTASADCGGEDGGECRFLSEPNAEERVGLCCRGQERQFEQPLEDRQQQQQRHSHQQHHKHSSSSTTAAAAVEERQGVCPATTAVGEPKVVENLAQCRDQCARDTECAGIQKCCPAADGGGDCRRCVQPMLATNCQNMVAALKTLEATHNQHFIPQPSCDPRRGTFSAVQCDGQSYCWCVDPQMGRPILGTRKLQPVGDFCSDRKACPIFCPQRRLLECAFGVELDLDGCPLTSDCRCRSPCEQVRCPDGLICVLRARDCQEQERNEQSQCLPVPSCQPSPCGGSQQPALGPVSKLTLTCRPAEGGNAGCPPGYRCTQPPVVPQSNSAAPSVAAGEGNGGGVCCPLAEEERGQAEAEEAESGTNNANANANPCMLPMSQGRRKHCARGMELRFFFEFSEQSCEEFVFAGCGGNANNFRSREECERRCLLPADAAARQQERQQQQQSSSSAAVAGTTMEMFDMGFELVAADRQKLLAQSTATGDDNMLESSLRSYLTRDFGLQEGQIRDVRFDPERGSVRFSIIAPDARRRAISISNALASGQFQFSHDDRLLRAQPEGWFARQVMAAGDDQQQEGSRHSKSSLFWVILTASVFFALLVLLLLCCGYAFLRGHSRSSSSSLGGGGGGSVSFSPSPHPLGHQIQHHWSPLPGRQKNMAEPLSSAEEVHRMRANAAAGGAAHLLTPMPSSTSSASNSATVQQAASSSAAAAPKIVTEETRRAERREGRSTTTMFY